MYHYGTVFLVVGTHIFEAESFGQVIVYLYRTQLPAATDGIFHHKVELRTVEGGFAIFYTCLQAFFLASLYNSAFGLLPVFVASYIFFAIIGVAERYLCLILLEVERIEYDKDDVHYFEELIFELVGTAEDVGIVLRKAAYTCQTVQLTALLITVNRSELGKSQGKVAI